MQNKYDLVIVGGGPAGISTALHVIERAPSLAARMLVLEKSRYPRDKICAGAIGARAISALAAIGVHVPVPSVPIHAMSFAAAGEQWIVREPGLGKVVRRVEFDAALANVARQRGVVVREDAYVEGIETTAHGVRIKLVTGDTLEARAVVGADGVSGVVRRSAGLSRGLLRAQAIEVDTEITPGDPPFDALHFDFGFKEIKGYSWDFPTLVGGERKMCRGVYRIMGERGEDARGRLERHLANKGLDLENYRAKPFAQRGFDPGEAISRPHVLLVGEAAGIDIATGEGIAQAIQYGALAAEYLAGAFRTGDLGFEGWLDRVVTRALGRELYARLWVYRRLYGRERPVLERLAYQSPDALRLGMRNFAGKPNGALGWAKALCHVPPALLDHGPAGLVRALRAPAIDAIQGPEPSRW